MIPVVAKTFYRLAGGNTTIPVTLGLRNIYILPTRYGLLYLAVLMAMFTGSINYSNNLGFLLTFLLGSLGLTAMLHTYGMLYGLRLESASGVPVFVGEPAEVEIILAAVNRQRHVLQWYFKAGDRVTMDLAPEGQRRVMLGVPTARRGRLNPGWLRIASDYPLGLFRAWARIDTGVQCLVYPRPIPAPLPAAVATSSTDGDDRLRTTGVDDFEALVAYQPGDPPHRIHWQAYSRGRGLHVKSFAGQAGAGLMLDMAQLAGTDTERKLGILCHHVVRAHHQRRHYAMQLGGRVIPVGSGRVHRDRCLRLLALFGSR